jgi:hypothetical protein
VPFHVLCRFCGKPVLREVLDFGSDDDDGDAGMEDVGAPGGSAPAPDPLSHVSYALDKAHIFKCLGQPANK